MSHYHQTFSRQDSTLPCENTIAGCMLQSCVFRPQANFMIDHNLCWPSLINLKGRPQANQLGSLLRDNTAIGPQVGIVRAYYGQPGYNVPQLLSH